MEPLLWRPPFPRFPNQHLTYADKPTHRPMRHWLPAATDIDHKGLATERAGDPSAGQIEFWIGKLLPFHLGGNVSYAFKIRAPKSAKKKMLIAELGETMWVLDGFCFCGCIVGALCDRLGTQRDESVDCLVACGVYFFLFLLLTKGMWSI